MFVRPATFNYSDGRILEVQRHRVLAQGYPEPFPVPMEGRGGRRRTIRRTGAVVAFTVVALLSGCTTTSDDGSGDDGSDALVERTCEIFRDIAADAGEVDSLAETRTRLKDLLNGYGEAAPPDIASPLRGIVSALTNNDVDQLESAVGELDSACSSRGV